MVNTHARHTCDTPYYDCTLPTWCDFIPYFGCVLCSLRLRGLLSTVSESRQSKWGQCEIRIADDLQNLKHLHIKAKI